MTGAAAPRPRRGSSAPRPKGVLAGEREPIFTYLPEEVRANMLREGSESAVVWNSFYPFTQDGLSFRAWCRIRPLWGSPVVPDDDDRLVPYFWGLRADGAPLEGLRQAAAAIAGREDRLEVDLFLKGGRVLIAIEAKTEGDPGRCGRYEAGRCPEIHGGDAACRYWEGGVTFNASLDFGSRPLPEAEERPLCAQHYQLARTLLIVEQLGRAEGLIPHLCLLVPRRRWPAMRGQWQDFAERVRDDGTWGRLRVVAWEDLEGLRGRPSS
jgi:hypothetical protein